VIRHSELRLITNTSEIILGDVRMKTPTNHLRRIPRNECRSDSLAVLRAISKNGAASMVVHLTPNPSP
jgi:hypothetical protein